MSRLSHARPRSALLKQAPSVATPRTMAATVGWLFVTAGLVGLSSALIVRPPTVLALCAIAAAGLVFGVVLILAGNRAPLVLLQAIPSLGALVVTTVVVLAHDPMLGRLYSALYLFVIVDSYLFFRWRFAAAHGALATALHLLTTWVTGQSPIGVLELHVVFGAIGLQLAWLVRLADTVGVDPVTGLLDRRRLDPVIEEKIAQAVRTGEPLSVVVVDLDDFGEVNRIAGVERGDEVLAGTAAALSGEVGELGEVYRYGSDEFLLLLPGVDDAGALVLVERLRRRVPSPFAVGVTEVVRGDTRASVTRRLVNALHQAQRGEHTVVAAGLDDGHDLRQAIVDGELELHYQPIVALPGGAPVGVEALVRWQRPDGSVMRPDAFIPRAEQDGSIVELGRWVLERALSDAAGWRDRPGMPRRVSVNVSHVELCRPGHARSVLDACARHDLDPGALVVELTETTLGLEDAHVMENLARLRAAGVGVSIDDFGTGYSSLARLHQMPVTELKIDRAFAADLDAEDRPRPVLVAIVALGRALELDMVAEGVETEVQARALAGLGVHRAQGWLFSRPMPSAELARAAGRTPTQRVTVD